MNSFFRGLKHTLVLIRLLGASLCSRNVNNRLAQKSVSRLSLCCPVKAIRLGLLAITNSCFVVAVASADDTEIFFDAEVNPPNVLFIVDVSGSMGWTDWSELPDIPGNVLWLDGSDRSTLLDADGDSADNWRQFSGTVATWLDKSAEGNHLSGASTTLGSINSQSTVRFTNDTMSGPDPFGGVMDEATIFFVQRENSSSNNFFLNFNGDSTGDGRVSFHTPWSNRNWYWDAGSWRTGNRSSIARPTDVGEATLVTAYKTVSGDENGFSLNNGEFSVVDAGATAAITSGGTHFGRGAKDHELAEIIVYDRKLNENEIKTIEEYLDKKWRTRLERLKTSLSSLVKSNDGINAGLMSYSSYRAGQFALRDEIKPIVESRDSLLQHIDDLYASGGTPTSSALFEAMLHYRGEAPREMGGLSSSGQPPAVQCQSNHVVLLTDGYPYGSQSTWNSIGSYIGSDCGTDRGSNMSGGNCGIELAQYMKDNDHFPAVRGVNNITTHTIGLSLDMPWLDNIAVAGGGGYYTASSSDQLLSAFQSIVDVAIDHATTFVSPSVTVDQFTRLSHREDTYLALFQPSTSMRWPGNLKRYSFSGSPPAIRDQNDEAVFDISTGTFTDDAHSFWSDTPDGAYTSQGGAASKQDVATRIVATYTANGSKSLIDSKNRVHEDNSSVLAPWFNVSGNSLNNLLKWARGVDVDDEDGDGSTNDTRHHMGDPLHSSPLIVNYGGSASDPDSAVFVGTNEGYLHSINSSDGTELFSFIPSALLGNLNTFYENSTSVTRPYGLDGDLTLWMDDKNSNGSVDAPSEHAYLYAGMRRGGRNYYALDVSEKNQPEFLWSIEGGVSGSDFAELGQTWSKPTKSKVRIGGDVTDVLIFGGGYDPAQDATTSRTADNIGNTVYVVDAADGSLIWKPLMDNNSDYSQMLYSIPSDPRIIDVDGDQVADQMYIGDMGGQIWRFDFNEDASSAADLVSGGLIAELATDEQENNRRFFYPPDVAVVVREGKSYLSVSVGSGNRAHPLGRDVHDRFYMILQDSLHQAPDGYGVVEASVAGVQNTYRPITEADLYNATDNDVDSSDGEISIAARSALEDASGWLLKLDQNGEKVLGTSITASYNIVFATYLPDSSGESDNACQPASGGNRGYVVNLFDASPITDPEHTADADPIERYKTLEQSGIAGSTAVIISSDNESVTVNAVTGLESMDMPTINTTRRVYWSEYPNF